MSYTTVKAIWPGARCENLEELRNSYGSAPPIWSAMCKKYCGTSEHGYMSGGALDKLWPRWKDLSIPTHQRAVLMMTYDRAYVAKKDYARAAADIKRFFEDFSINPEHVNHWPRIRAIFESDPDIPGIGLHCTSVSDDPFDGPWNEELEEYDQPDWSQIFSIYDGLDEVESHA